MANGMCQTRYRILRDARLRVKQEVLKELYKKPVPNKVTSVVASVEQKKHKKRSKDGLVIIRDSAVDAMTTTALSQLGFVEPTANICGVHYYGDEQKTSMRHGTLHTFQAIRAGNLVGTVFQDLSTSKSQRVISAVGYYEYVAKRRLPKAFVRVTAHLRRGSKILTNEVPPTTLPRTPVLELAAPTLRKIATEAYQSFLDKVRFVEAPVTPEVQLPPRGKKEDKRGQAQGNKVLLHSMTCNLSCICMSCKRFNMKYTLL